MRWLAAPWSVGGQWQGPLVLGKGSSVNSGAGKFGEESTPVGAGEVTGRK